MFKPLVRSSNTGRNREDYDKSLEQQPLEIEDNYTYRRILSRGYNDDYFLHGDLRKLLDEIDRAGENVREPSKRSLDHYRSFLTFPIYGKGTADPNRTAPPTPAPINPLQHEEGVLLQYRDHEVFGLMCVDSNSKNAFDNGYDLEVITQLTSFAFSAFRMVRELQQTASSHHARTTS